MACVAHPVVGPAAHVAAKESCWGAWISPQEWPVLPTLRRAARFCWDQHEVYLFIRGRAALHSRLLPHGDSPLGEHIRFTEL